MNWGHKITIVIIAFIVIMMSMVFVAFRQTNEMEDTNYYEKELKYQSKIDAANNLSDASSDTILTPNRQGLLVHIPHDLMTDFKNGRLEFIKSDDQKKDLNLSFAPDTAGNFQIEKSRFSNGFYKARVQWDNGAQHFYREQQVFIN